MTIVYTTQKSLPFGLCASVLQFNRLPLLITASLRRRLVVVAGHYFDDNMRVELVPLAAITKNQFPRFMRSVQVSPAADKHHRISAMSPFLGHDTDFTRVQTDSAAVISQSRASVSQPSQR